MNARIQYVTATPDGRSDVWGREIPVKTAPFTFIAARGEFFGDKSRSDCVKIWVGDEEVAHYSKWDFLRDFHGIDRIDHGNRLQAEAALRKIGRTLI